MHLVLATNSNLQVKVFGPFQTLHAADWYADQMTNFGPFDDWQYLAIETTEPLSRTELAERKKLGKRRGPDKRQF